jgi:hypothetical protein
MPSTNLSKYAGVSVPPAADVRVSEFAAEFGSTAAPEASPVRRLLDEPLDVEPPAPGGPTSGYEKYIRHPGWTDPSIPFPPAPKRRDTPDLSISPSSRRDATAAERKRRQRQRDRERKQSKTLEGTHQQPPIGGGRGIQPD